MSWAPPPYPPPGPPQVPPEQPPPAGYDPWQRSYDPYRPPRPVSPRRRGGVLGALLAVLAAVAAYGKYALLFLLKFGAFQTLLSLLISFGAYALFGGPWFAAGLVLMILCHEMGHVVEIRRQGMRASAPLFIPFFGAAIFQRQHPTDALKQAQIGIAGPIAGTLAATAAFVLYGSTHWVPLLLWAYLGFFINLFNLIPIGMLDGGWILAVVSKWFQVLGLAALVVAVFWLGFSPIVLIIALLAVPAMIERFRNDRLPYYRSVPVPARLAMGAAWLFLTGYLGFAVFEAHQVLQTLVG
ncbi:MAG TPA: site-2 protease family protein [Candidatus Dormibacteraeota bacterium]|nr:site-2 protease family protein [Candidatus Dormibacteraeota bacterium]